MMAIQDELAELKGKLEAMSQEKMALMEERNEKEIEKEKLKDEFQDLNSKYALLQDESNSLRNKVNY